MLPVNQQMPHIAWLSNIKWLSVQSMSCIPLVKNVRLLLIPFTIFLSSQCVVSQNTANCDLFKKTIAFYNEFSLYPIDPGKFNISQFQDDFLSSMDPDALYFSGKDFQLFPTIQQAVINDYSTSFCNLESELMDAYRQNLENTIEIFENLKAYHFDFLQQDSIYIGSGPFRYRYELDKHSRITQYLKSIMMRDIIQSTAYYDSIKQDTEVLADYIDSLQIRKIQREINQTKQILDHPDVCREKLYSAFINGFLTQFDPYAYLFSNKAYNEFKEALSGNSSFFGFQLESNKHGEVIIASVIPGSSAWKTGMINSGDKVLKFESEKRGSIIIEENEISDIADFLADITSEKLTITLLKADKKTITVDLYREKIENTENSVQAFILNGEHKVGYIILPAFYTSWESQNQFGCAQDVGRVIYYLKKENIESLIIDLRNNSGGSMREAIDLTGLFIDYGTLLVSKNKNNELISIKDPNRGTIYTDPLAILVNQHSASASELVAAVLQDYNRAIIIGDTTYGKATGQMLQAIKQDDEMVMKITTNKYYRVTGDHYNLKGVIPDIVLPDFFSQNDNSRITQPADNGDIIARKTYYIPLTTLPKDSLREKSGLRVAQNSKFKLLSDLDRNYSLLYGQKSYLPLDFQNFYQIIRQKEWMDLKINEYREVKTNYFTVSLLPKDEGTFKINTYYAYLYNNGIQNILADPYIEETLRILTDYIHIKQD